MANKFIPALLVGYFEAFRAAFTHQATHISRLLSGRLC